MDSGNTSKAYKYFDSAVKRFGDKYPSTMN